MSVTARDKRKIVEAASGVYGRATGASNSTTWVQLISAATAPCLIIMVTHDLVNQSVTAWGSIELGLGGAGAEVTIATLPQTFGSGAYASFAYPLPYPILIPTNGRLAFRHTGSATVGTVGVVYVYESAVI